jgi:hypothetical protein
VPPEQRVRAWRPAIPGVAEVLHARFVDHAYPVHTHDTWTLLIVDDGAIRYDLDRHSHGTSAPTSRCSRRTYPTTGGPRPGGASASGCCTSTTTVLGEELVGAAASGPSVRDPVLRQRIHQLHASLADPSATAS